MLHVWENSSIKSWWRDRHVSLASAPSVKSFLVSVSMRSSARSLSTSPSVDSCSLELETKLRWQLPLIKPFISPLSLSQWESNYKLNMVKLIWNVKLRSLRERRPSLRIKLSNLSLRLRLSRSATVRDKRLSRRNALRSSSSSAIRSSTSLSLSRLSVSPSDVWRRVCSFVVCLKSSQFYIFQVINIIS